MTSSRLVRSGLALTLLFLGVGCTATTPGDALPSTPPDSARIEGSMEGTSQIDPPSLQLEAGPADTSVDTETAASADLDMEVDVDTSVEDGSVMTDTDVHTEGAMKAPADAEPYYIEYSDEEFEKARAEGRPIALYFWAAWCPICRAEEPALRAQIDGLDLPVAGFRVNFDTATALKKKYAIPYQHTLVILGTDGEEVTRFLGPVSSEERYDAYAEAYAN